MQKKWRGRVISHGLIFGFILVLGFLLGIHNEALAGITGKIAGVVTDAKTGEALPAANCILVGTEQGAACDAAGCFFIINISPGTYSLKVTMMGYESVTKTGIEVESDHTTKVDFELQPTEVEVPGITVVAKREVVKMDLSSSSVTAESREIATVPLVNDIKQYIGLQAGIEDMVIRGGGMDQTAFMMDGLMLVDDRSNTPITMPNISSIKEIGIIKGGFNAEYGNVRSGVVNVVTQEGSPNEYHGSIDFRLSPAHLKHGGASLFSPDNYYLRSYLDPEVCWEGTANGGWDKETQAQNKKFIGWNAVSADLLADDDPTNDMTPEECRELFIWQHACEGASELIPDDYKGDYKEGKYGDKPDWNVDLGFGGPVPVIGKYLGKMSFFVSYRDNWEAFALPTYRDYYKENNLQLKLTSHISPKMKLDFEGLYGEINTIAQGVYWPQGPDDYIRSGDGIFSSERFSERYMYWPSCQTPFDIYMDMQGISLDHSLSSKTFYKLRLTHIHRKNLNTAPQLRDTTTIRYFGDTPVDEAPYNFWDAEGSKSMTDGMWYCGYADARDWSEVNTVNFNADLTSQIDKYHQIKTGLTINYDDIYTNYAAVGFVIAGDQFEAKSENYPIRIGAYAQDKIEFAGMIANVGVRLDYIDPNTDWYTVDRYSEYFSPTYKNVFTEVCPKAPAKSHLKISPRLGISHPISENSKLYFNYGHFYSMAPSNDLYMIRYGSLCNPSEGFMGNPSADMPKTVAYELGYEHNIGNLFLFHLDGYYKDVSNQTGQVRYTNYDGTVDYSTVENNNYEDIRGFEVSLDKRVGGWIKGWINYNYMVTTSGFTGRDHYFQDERLQKIYGLKNPYQERPVARPLLRANIQFASPEDWGPTIAGIKPLGGFSLNFLYSWKAGEWMTWDPLHTYKLQDNLQWVDYSNLDLRLNKEFSIAGNRISIFMDIENLLNTKRMSALGFADAQDELDYYYSLHLPMYKGEEYEQAGFEGGDDKPGDIKSKDKPYINMPNRDFLTYLDLRNITFGLRFGF
jgi:hypothetical protein